VLFGRAFDVSGSFVKLSGRFAPKLRFDKCSGLMYNLIKSDTIQVFSAMKTLRALVVVLSNLSLTLVIGEGP
jgi:hypothetical protein